MAAVKKGLENQWTREQCRDRYVMGEEIGVRSLAKLANRPVGTVARWCGEDQWLAQRDQHMIAIRSKTESKVIEANSSAIAERYTDLDEEHLKGFELFRKMSLQFAGILLADIQQQNRNNSDRKTQIINPSFSLAMQRYSGMFTEMAKMERLVTGADYQVIDKAIALVTKEGYDVTNPSSELMAEFLREEGYIVEKKEEKQITQSA